MVKFPFFLLLKEDRLIRISAAAFTNIISHHVHASCSQSVHRFLQYNNELCETFTFQWNQLYFVEHIYTSTFIFDILSNHVVSNVCLYNMF